MNIRLITKITGHILILEALLLLLPLGVSIFYQETCTTSFLITILITLLIGFLMGRTKLENKTFYAKEGFAIVAFSWIGMSLFGALPFFISREIPSYMDALFETISGFTTTGASILTEIEGMSKGLLFWRSFTHWIGGMGVLVLIMVVLPTGENSMHIMRAEMPGHAVSKLLPRFKDTAKVLYSIYSVLTLIQIIFLLFGGMSLFDSAVHAFGTAGTGGFSSRNLSIAAYNSPYIEWVIGIFMLLFGINFNLYFLLLVRNFKSVYRNEELRWYLSIITIASVSIAITIIPFYNNFSESFRHSFFQVASIITTTGYATADFNVWPQFARTALVLLMICGACAGSTGGGLKVSRLMLLFRGGKRELNKMLHPRSVKLIVLDGKPVEEKTINSVSFFFVIYIGIALLTLVLLSCNGFDLETNLTAMIACLNNIGPGLNMVGPLGNYSEFSIVSKLILSVNMLLGRLEIYPILLLLMPLGWAHRKNTVK